MRAYSEWEWNLTNWYQCCLPKQIVEETSSRCSSNLNLCLKNRVFLSDGFQKFQKIYDFICPGAMFLVVDLGFTILLLWLILVQITARTTLSEEFPTFFWRLLWQYFFKEHIPNEMKFSFSFCSKNADNNILLFTWLNKTSIALHLLKERHLLWS